MNKRLNKKGFTLIELLAVINILAIVSTIIVVGVVNNAKNAKQKSYEIMVNNIVTASKQYYEECQYNSDNSLECPFNGSKLSFSLKTLVSYGFLTGSNKDEVKTIVNPKTNNDIGNCEIEMEKKVSNLVVTYTVSSSGGATNCPTTAEYGGNFS